MPVLIDKNDDTFIEYNAIYINPKSFGALNNPLASKIIQSLSSSPMCAIDVARLLNEPEHKIYYHLNKLQKAGIVKLVGTEKRYGMVAQLYDIVSPVIAAKIHDGGRVVERSDTHSIEVHKFFEPFIVDGELNCKIILGDVHPHGKYAKVATESPYTSDLMIFIGTMLRSMKRLSCKLDTEVNEIDLHDNLILIGNAATNVIIDKINDFLPAKFSIGEEMTVSSKKTGSSYKNPYVGVICKIDNPFAADKKILVLGGVRGRGTRAAIVGLTQKFSNLMQGIVSDSNISKIVEGIDRDGDKIIDDVNILE